MTEKQLIEIAGRSAGPRAVQKAKRMDMSLAGYVRKLIQGDLAKDNFRKIQAGQGKVVVATLCVREEVNTKQENGHLSEPAKTKFLDMTFGEVWRDGTEEAKAFLLARGMNPEGSYITIDAHKGRRVTVRVWDRWNRRRSHRTVKVEGVK